MTKYIVSVPLTIPPNPCDNHPNSLAVEISHSSLYFEYRLRCLYSSILPVSASSTEFSNSISASLWYVTVLPFICATISIILTRCSPLYSLATIVFCAGPFYVVVLVDTSPLIVYSVHVAKSHLLQYLLYLGTFASLEVILPPPLPSLEVLYWLSNLLVDLVVER